MSVDYRWLMTCLVCALASQAKAQPLNIILILSDDVGAETIGAYGGESYQTPSLDRLARDGVRFDHGHAQPLCTPSRVKIMTGKYNFRNYTHFGFLDPAEKTFAHLLRDAGYRAAIAGKWQLYTNPFQNLQGSTPETAGFDEYLLWQLNPEQKGSRYWQPLLNHNGELVQHNASVFGPDVLNDYALDYIDRYKSEPFFLYYSMVLAHDPWVTTPDMRDENAGDEIKFAAMMAYMDKMVGNVRAAVEAAGIAENTVIFFIGDNGTDRDITSRQHGLDVRGAKGATITHGTRVPFIVWGADFHGQAGVSDNLVNLNDILPTLAELAGIDLPDGYPGDGHSLVGMLRGKAGRGRESLFIHYEPRWPTGLPARYAFDHRWKLYEDGRFYDMQADILEEHALDFAKLDAGGLQAYRQLQVRIDEMPGGLRSTRRWLPSRFYYIAAAALLVLLALIWCAWHLVARLQR